jgi:DME family drug/metabolite transporter
LAVLVAASLWGTTGTARALGPHGADPIAVGSARLVLGGTLLWTLAAVRGARPRMADWSRGALVTATVAMAAYQRHMFGGVSRAGVAVGTVVGIGTSPMAGGLLARLVRHERLGRRWFVATGLGLLGAILLAVGAGVDGSGDGATGRGGPPGPAGGAVVVGLALATGAGVAYAIYVAASAILLDRHDPDQVAAGVLGGAGLLLVPVGLLAGVGWLAQPDGLATAAWLGLVTVALAYPLLTRGLRRIGVGATATLTLAEPATAATLGLVVLGERLRPPGWLGLALVGSGVLLETGARRGAPIEP